MYTLALLFWLTVLTFAVFYFNLFPTSNFNLKVDFSLLVESLTKQTLEDNYSTCLGYGKATHDLTV